MFSFWLSGRTSLTAFQIDGNNGPLVKILRDVIKTQISAVKTFFTAEKNQKDRILDAERHIINTVTQFNELRDNLDTLTT